MNMLSARNQPNSHQSPPPKMPASNQVAAVNTRLARKAYFNFSLSRRFRSTQPLAATSSTSAISSLTIVGLRGSQLQTLVSLPHSGASHFSTW